jgi:hypothetical protein
VAQKIKNLRTTYYREVNKIAVSKKSTSSWELVCERLGSYTTKAPLQVD